jgi:hypothetical protein
MCMLPLDSRFRGNDTAASLALHFPGCRAVFVVLKRDPMTRVIPDAQSAIGNPDLTCVLARDSRFRGNDTAGSLALHLPGSGAVFIVFQRDAHGGEFVADAVGFFPVFCGAGGEAKFNSPSNDRLVDVFSP